nr:hypothetical protein [uncultured Massilia sp.]
MKTFTIPTAATVSLANQAIFENLQKGLGMVSKLYATATLDRPTSR